MVKLTRKRLVLFSVFVFAIVSLMGCGSSSDADRVIKVGFPAPLSGSSAGWGSDMEHGITLAIEEINEKGGILGHQVELVSGDVENQEPSVVNTVVRRLISRDKVDIMVTGAANPSLVELDLMQQNKMPYVLYGYAMAQERLVPENPDNYTYIHNAIPSYERYRTAFPELIDELEKNGEFEPVNHKVAIIKSQNEYSLYTGEGMQETFKNMGWEIVIDETIPYSRFTEFEPILSQIRDKNPSIIMYTDHTAANAASFLNSFLQNPTASLVFLQATPSYPEFQEIVGGKQEGVFWNYAASLLGENAVIFNEKYEKRWGEQPNPYGAFVYDAMMLAADAMEKSGDPFNRENVNEVLHSTDYSYEGFVGMYRFDPKTRLALSGEDGIPFVTYQEWGDEHVVLSPAEHANGQFKLPPWYEAALKK